MDKTVIRTHKNKDLVELVNTKTGLTRYAVYEGDNQLMVSACIVEAMQSLTQ